MEPETRDQGPEIRDPQTPDAGPISGETWDLKVGPGTGDRSHGCKPGPGTIKVGLNTLSIYGTRDPRTRTLNMNDFMCLYIYFICFSLPYLTT